MHHEGLVRKVFLGGTAAPAAAPAAPAAAPAAPATAPATEPAAGPGNRARATGQGHAASRKIG